MYCAIIGDMIDSRESGDRAWLQKQLKKNLDDINRKHAGEMASLFTVTIGDEFQGLLTNTGNLFDIIDRLKFNMAPQKFRFGIGLGGMDTPIDKRISIGADGPAYHNAREAIEILKYSENKYEQPYKDMLVVWDNPSQEVLINLINAALASAALIENSWTAKQREVIDILFECGCTQKSLAKKLGIKQTSVHRRLKSADYYNYKYAKKAVGKMLDTIMKEAVHG